MSVSVAKINETFFLIESTNSYTHYTNENISLCTGTCISVVLENPDIQKSLAWLSRVCP